MRRGFLNRARRDAGSDNGSTSRADPQERPDVTQLSRALTDAGLATYLDTRVPSGRNAYSPAGTPSGTTHSVLPQEAARGGRGTQTTRTMSRTESECQ